MKVDDIIKNGRKRRDRRRSDIWRDGFYRDLILAGLLIYAFAITYYLSVY